MMINEFVKQKTSDEEFQSFKMLIPPSLLAYYYVVGAKQSITLDMVIKTGETEKIIEPYMRAYLLEKEAMLGKSRLLFSEKEREETMKELDDVYYNLKEKGIVY